MDPEHAVQRLAELDLAVELFHVALGQAAVDTHQCTGLDAPALAGIIFWSRTNRYLAEQLLPKGWLNTTRDSILRVIHPSRSHAITAISASGNVGDLDGTVRSKNPKGSAMARLVEKNGQISLLTPDQLLYGRELDDIPTWMLLYKRDHGTVIAELSLPVKMTGKYVNEWKERIPLHLPDLGDPGSDIDLLDDPLNGPLSPEVLVEVLAD